VFCTAISWIKNEILNQIEENVSFEKECVFKNCDFENIEKYAFQNRKQGGAFLKTYDFKVY
jgi:hypothetical protein